MKVHRLIYMLAVTLLSSSLFAGNLPQASPVITSRMLPAVFKSKSGPTQKLQVLVKHEGAPATATIRLANDMQKTTLSEGENKFLFEMPEVHALGDLLIFVIYGQLIALGTTYVMTSDIDLYILAVSAPIGFLIVNILHDVVCSISRPVKELKGFQRIHLAKGESKDVTFTITPDLLKFYNYNLDYTLEPGEFEVMVGPDSSAKNLHKLSFVVK